MNYKETLSYLFESLPMYQRVGAAAYKADLENTIAIMDVLNNPYRNFKSIHVAGTNGKGSVSHMMASILQEAGYKVGLYTSPHLIDFRERIRINGIAISEKAVCKFVKQYKSDFERIKPSFFEMTVGMAFDYFANEKVDIAIIEVGMGGRLDSTNVITPLLSIITNIGLDHTQFLGNTISKIASEKAGIIKQNIPVIIGESNPESNPVFDSKAKELDAPIIYAEKMVKIEDIDPSSIFDKKIVAHIHSKTLHINSPLAGNYQLKNIASVLCSIERLNTNRDLIIPEKSIQNGIENVIKNTEFKGRWQKLQNIPLIICDTGHNAHGLSITIPKLMQIPCSKLHIVLGTVNDKNINEILALFPQNAEYYFCKANIPRALDSDELRKIASKYNLIGKSFLSVKEAVKVAINSANPKDLIFIGGSNFVVADALPLFPELVTF